MTANRSLTEWVTMGTIWIVILLAFGFSSKAQMALQELMRVAWQRRKIRQVPLKTPEQWAVEDRKAYREMFRNPEEDGARCPHHLPKDIQILVLDMAAHAPDEASDRERDVRLALAGEKLQANDDQLTGHKASSLNGHHKF